VVLRSHTYPAAVAVAAAATEGVQEEVVVEFLEEVVEVWLLTLTLHGFCGEIQAISGRPW